MIIAVVVSDDDVSVVIVVSGFVARMTNFNRREKVTATMIKIIKEMQ